MSVEKSIQFNLFDLIASNYTVLENNIVKWGTDVTPSSIPTNTNGLAAYNTPHDRIRIYLDIINTFLLTGDIKYVKNGITVQSAPIINNTSPGFINNLYRNPKNSADCINSMLDKGYKNLYENQIKTEENSVNVDFTIAHGQSLTNSYNFSTVDKSNTIIYLVDVLNELKIFIDILSQISIFECHIIMHNNRFSGGYTTVGSPLRYINPADNDSRWESANYVVSPYSQFKVFKNNSYGHTYSPATASRFTPNTFVETSYYMDRGSEVEGDYKFTPFQRNIGITSTKTYKTLIYKETPEITPSMPFNISHRFGSNGVFKIYHQYNNISSRNNIISLDDFNITPTNIISRSHILSIIDTIFETWSHNIPVSQHILHMCHSNCHGNNTKANSAKTQAIAQALTKKKILPYESYLPLKKAECEFNINIMLPQYSSTHENEISSYIEAASRRVTMTKLEPNIGTINFSLAKYFCPQMKDKILSKYRFSACQAELFDSGNQSKYVYTAKNNIETTTYNLESFTNSQYNMIIDDNTLTSLCRNNDHSIIDDIDEYVFKRDDGTADILYSAELCIILDTNIYNSSYIYETNGYSIFLKCSDKQIIFSKSEYVNLGGSNTCSKPLMRNNTFTLRNGYRYTNSQDSDKSFSVGDTNTDNFFIEFSSSTTKGVKNIYFYTSYDTIKEIKTYSTIYKATNLPILSSVRRELTLTGPNNTVFGNISATDFTTTDITRYSYPSGTALTANKLDVVKKDVDDDYDTTLSIESPHLYFTTDECDDIAAKFNTLQNGRVNLYFSRNNTLDYTYSYSKEDFETLFTYSSIIKQNTKSFNLALLLARNNYTASLEENPPCIEKNSTKIYMPCGIFKLQCDFGNEYNIEITNSMSIYADEDKDSSANIAHMKIFSYHWCVVPLYAFSCVNSAIGVDNTINSTAFIWGTNGYSKDYTISVKLSQDDTNNTISITANDITKTINKNRYLYQGNKDDPDFINTVLFMVVGSEHSPLGHFDVSIQ